MAASSEAAVAALSASELEGAAAVSAVPGENVPRSASVPTSSGSAATAGTACRFLRASASCEACLLERPRFGILLEIVESCAQCR